MTPIHWYTIAICFSPLAARVIIDRHTIVKRQVPVPHLDHTILSGITILLVSTFLWMLDKVDFFRCVVFVYFFGFIPWFDYLINIFTGKNWYYVPDLDDRDASWWDRWRLKMNWLGELFFKFIIGFIGYAVYYQWQKILG